MPYARNADLPKPVRDALPAAAQTVYRKAFNSFEDDNPDADESRSHRVAWAAVRRGWRKQGNTWVARDSEEETTMDFRDSVKMSSVRRTDDGYLTAYVNVARPGIQLYKGHEVGRPDLETVRVYRPPEEVFSPDSMRTFAHRPVTIDHPPGAVNAENWKDLSVGMTGEEVDGRDGKFLRVPLVLMDAAAIKRVEDGHRELSMGYTTNLRFEDGVTEDGDEYDAVQSDIRANHLAVVRAARGGPDLKIGDDHKEGVAKMTMRNITVDGVSVEVPDTAAQVITRTVERLTADLKARDSELETAQAEVKSLGEAQATKEAEAKSAIEAKEAEIATLKSQLEESKVTPEQLDSMVKARDEAIGKARTLLGDGLQTDGRTLEDIRRQVVTAKLGDSVVKPWTDEQVAISFATLTASTQPATPGHPAHDGRDIGKALQRPGQVTADQAYEERNKRLSEAWRGKTADA